MAPEVTVVMAARNAEPTVLEAIRSVLAQEFADWELIVVDDASTDRTRAIAESVADPRIRVVAVDDNVGAARARNLAIREARGALIAIADADDISLPARLAEQVRAFAEHPDLGVLGAQLVEFGPWGQRDGAAVFPTDPDDIERLFVRGRMGIAHPAAMFRRDLALAVGGYDESLARAEDLALFLRMRPVEMRALPDRLVRYRTADRVGFAYVRREVRAARRANGRAGRGEALVTTAIALRSVTVRRLRERIASTRAARRG